MAGRINDAVWYLKTEQEILNRVLVWQDRHHANIPYHLPEISVYPHSHLSLIDEDLHNLCLCLAIYFINWYATGCLNSHINSTYITIKLTSSYSSQQVTLLLGLICLAKVSLCYLFFNENRLSTVMKNRQQWQIKKRRRKWCYQVKLSWSYPRYIW